MTHIAQCRTIITKCGKKLWKIKSIPRHIHFFWRILHEELPVKNDLKGSFRSLNFSHVRREVNQSTHYLAKYALKNLDCIWIEETPSCISAVSIFDLLSDSH